MRNVFTHGDYIDLEEKCADRGRAKTMRNNVMKDMRFLLVVVAMLTVTLFVPWEAHAAYQAKYDISTGDVVVDGCGTTCAGHEITGTSTKSQNHNIIVKGSHTITLKGLSVETDVTPGSAFSIEMGNVELKLEGENYLKAGAGAALNVPSSGYLTINGPGKLTAIGGNTGAGIGGQSGSAAGTIRIKSGTIDAKGGQGAAGIGGGAGGNAGTILIEGGTITAEGGDNTNTNAMPGGAGIGRGNAGSGGTVTIKGGTGTVTATGGMGIIGGLNNRGHGIHTSVLTSDGSDNMKMEIIAVGQGTGITADNMQKFNGVVGNGQTGSSNRYIVYGDAKLGDPWLPVDGGSVEISEGGSLTLDTNTSNKWSLGNGKVIGSGKLINDFMITDGTFGSDVLTYPRYIKEDMVPKKIPDQEYTGDAVEPDVVIKDGKGGSITLQRNKDYRLTYEDNVKVGTAKMWIWAVAPDYLDVATGFPIEREFKIVPTNIKKIEMSVSPDEAVYNKKKHDFDITVTDGTHTLSPKDDYDIEYDENADFVNAGEIGVTIKGKGNYTGTVKKTLTIKPRPVDIIDAKAADRDYNGTREVTMTEVVLNQDDIIEGDTVKVDTKGLAGIIANADVGEYDTITFDPDSIKLIDENGKAVTNYVARVPEGSLDLDPPVTISKLKHGTPVATGKSEASRRYEDKFACRITVEDPKPGATYLYRQGVEGEEQESNYFDNLDVNQWYTFVVRVEDNHNVEAPKEPDDQYLVRVYVDKLEQEPPEPFQIDFKKNEDGTSYTATMPEKENVLYSFDGGQTWLTLESGGNIKTNCEPGHPYVGQMKYVEDATHKESEPRIVEATAPMEQVQPPTISPNGGEFKGSQQVTMTCETRDAVIYYTLDGSDPKVDGDEIGDKTKRYTKPFEITDAANIKAIATKQYMQNSRVTTAKFDLDDSLETRVTRTDLSQVEVPSSLREVGYTSISDITAALSRVLTAHSGYTYQNIAYYDITVMVSNDRKSWREAKLEDFPDDGLTITVPYPTGTTKAGNDFIAAHMFTATDARLGIEAGGIEEPTVSKTANGIEMKIKGTSPLGVAWKAAAASNGNANATTNGSNSSNDANGANGTAARAQANSDNSNGKDKNGGGSDEEGDGSTDDGAAGNASDSSSSSAENGGGLASLLPQTSDGRTILLWVVLALLSAAILGGLKFKRKRD